jgi:hypothetical protein
LELIAIKPVNDDCENNQPNSAGGGATSKTKTATKSMVAALFFVVMTERFQHFLSVCFTWQGLEIHSAATGGCYLSASNLSKRGRIVKQEF